MAKLLVQESDGAREFELVDLEVNIGRELDNTLRLSDPSISRHHAVIRQTTEGFEVQDLGSSNGVLLNGTKVQTAQLHDGDRITLGQMQLTFVDPRPQALAPGSPLGTVRMNLEDMAKLQGSAVPEPPPAPAPIPMAAAPAPLPPPPAPQPPPRAQAPWPTQAPADNPAPGFLQPYLPSIPDDAEPVLAGGAIERGDFGSRFLAYLIDVGVGLGLAILFWLAVAVLTIATKGCAIFACGLYPIVGLGYLVFMLWCQVTFRATIGKKIMKLRIVPEDNPAGNIDWGMAILRLIGHLVSGFFFDLPYLLILGAERKGLQDMFSRSIVIKVDR